MAGGSPEPGAQPAASPPCLTRLPDGTLKQVSPLTGTVVWSVPGRSHRPIPVHPGPVRELDPDQHRRACAFCADRLLETPPERARLVRDPQARDPGGLLPGWRLLRDLPAEQLTQTSAQFRRIPNLYPILPLAYWRADHGLQVPPQVRARARDYVASPEGRAHLLGIRAARAGAAGADERGDPGDEDLFEQSLGLFASTHDLVVARRHYIDGAATDDLLCAAGDLTAEEHLAFLALTVDALRDLTGTNPHARYVAVFQNWLRPAGASFDHLHKQLVAIDEWGPLMSGVVDLVRRRPQVFNEEVADVAARNRLVVAENDHAVVLAGVGHRYPTLELYSTGATHRPWEHEAEALRGVSALLHACHVATGAGTATNEEWHYRPVDAEMPMPWRINLKWRVSTLAGFEGGTRINVNTIDPFSLRDRVVASLADLREAGRIGPLRIGDECSHRRGILRYGG
jgi:galactose-1-phosphate uridylyltransferase